MLNSARPYGPIVVHRNSIPTDVDIARHDERVDLTPFIGSAVPITLEAARLLLGLSFRAMHTLLDAGVFERHAPQKENSRTYVMLDPGTCVRPLYDAWLSRKAMPETHEEFDEHRTVRRICSIPHDEPLPSILLEGAFRRLMEHGNFTIPEIRIFLPLHPDNTEITLAWLAERRDTAQRKRQTGPRSGLSIEDLRAALPPSMREAPFTCLTADLPYEFEAPSPAIVERLLRLDRLFVPASLYALTTAPSIRRTEVLRERLVALERVQEIFDSFSPDRELTADDVETALLEYLYDERAISIDPPAVRVLTVSQWAGVTQALQIYLSRIEPELASAMKPYLPPVFEITSSIAAEIRNRFGDLRAEGVARRRKIALTALANLELILTAATNRRDELRTFGEAYRNELDQMGPSEESRILSVSVPSLDAFGHLAGGMNKVRFKIWRTGAAWRSLLQAPAVTKNAKQIAKKREGKDLTEYDEPFIVEHMGTETSDGSPVSEPWMIGLDRLGVAHSFATANAHLKEKRHRTICALGLPGNFGCAGGLLTFDQERAALKQNGLDQNRHFFPLEEVEHALRLAYVVLDCVSQSYNRAQEIRQLVRLEWKKLETGEGEIRHLQKTRPKVPRRVDLAKVQPVDVVITETTLNEIFDLCDLQERRCSQAEFPTMEAAPEVRWKCPPAEYVISYNGMALTRSQCAVFLRYLLAGWPAYTYHDFRHVMAKDAALDDYTVEDVAAMLGQSTEAVAEDYMSLVGFDKELQDYDSLGRRMAAQDQRLGPLESPGGSR